MDLAKKNLILELDKLVEERKRRETNNVLEYYRPQSPHWDFLVSYKLSGKTLNYFIASNQVGKTTVGCILIRAMVLGHHSWMKNFAEHVRDNYETIQFPKSGWWFSKRAIDEALERFSNMEDLDEFDKTDLETLNKRKQGYCYDFKDGNDVYDYIMQFEDTGVRRPAQVAVCAKDFKKGVGVVYWPKLQELIPGPYKNGPYIKSITYMQGRIPEEIHFQNGSKIVFFSGEMDPFRFEGGTWDAIFWDEPPKQEHFVAMDRGTLVKDAPMFFHMTPLSEPWIFDHHLQEVGKQDSKVYLSTLNLFSSEVHWMTKQKKKDFEKEVYRENPHNVEARVHGRFTHLLGRIYPTYDEDIHLIPSNKIEQLLSQNVTHGVTVDPHDRRPFAIGFWFVTPDNDLVFYKNYPIELMPEIKSCDLTVSEYAKMMLDEQSRLREGKISYWFGDPNKLKTPRKTSGHSGQTLLDEFCMEGVYFDVEINNSLEDGHSAVRDYLYYDNEQPISHTNKPKIYISEDCLNVHTSMTRYTWDEKKSKTLASEVPHEKWKDFADIVRYTCIKRPIWLSLSNLEVRSPQLSGRIHDRPR